MTQAYKVEPVRHMSGADLVLAMLRANKESGNETVYSDGSIWCDVYLDNAKPVGMNAHQFAGCLSALERRGDYKPVDGFAWGSVRIPG
jgi:hypothetical protein